MANVDNPRNRPIIVTDVLDTLVIDPFFNGMASFFNFDSMQQLMDAKTPGVWIDFELGLINETQLAEQFFKDRRHVDIKLLKQFLKNTYQLIPGVNIMLDRLRRAQIEVHVCSNYPIWADLIEESVGLSSRFGVQWTFVSARHGIRKPDLRAFSLVAQLAGVDMSSCILLDDREKNCQAAQDAGYLAAIHFENTEQVCRQLETILSQRRIDIQLDITHQLKN